MLAVKLEIAIDRPYAAIGDRLGHAHQTGVGKSHWAVAVATHQIAEAAMLVMKAEIAAQKTGFNQRKQIVGAMAGTIEQGQDFGYHGIACRDRNRRVLALFDCPLVVPVVGTQQRHQRPAVYQPGGHLP
jgi:hypothetical protein